MPVLCALTTPTQSMLAIAASTAEPPRDPKMFLHKHTMSMHLFLSEGLYSDTNKRCRSWAPSCYTAVLLVAECLLLQGGLWQRVCIFYYSWRRWRLWLPWRFLTYDELESPLAYSTENWHSTYSGVRERLYQFWFFFHFCFRVMSPYGTDSRTVA